MSRYSASEAWCARASRSGAGPPSEREGWRFATWRTESWRAAFPPERAGPPVRHEPADLDRRAARALARRLGRGLLRDERVLRVEGGGRAGGPDRRGLGGGPPVLSGGAGRHPGRRHRLLELEAE